ncbi:polyprotein [Carrot torradovirus 1]|uniref:Polyprotein n=1 Tax=Carrot torradovirus 1 TaxID=1425364 RepID=A0A0A0P522_9SECO|nr:polyprotein [Carrot torradovirus 1]AHA85557.1 polyprotein [Carrot torradovirus 1]
MAAMIPSSSRGLTQGMQTNMSKNEQLTNSVREFFDAVSHASENSKKNGMGCFTILRANSEDWVAAELLDPNDKALIINKWSVLKAFKLNSNKKDSMLQYYHLHGVVFLMVPHVMATDQGEVIISLHSGNDPLEPISQKKISLSNGPAAIVMNAPICLPLVPEQATFYYQVKCSGSSASIPCSVMAMWKQEISTKVAMYEDEDVVSWILEKLRHPALLKSSHAAAQLISAYYSSGDREADLNPKPQLGFSRSLKSMDVYATLKQGEKRGKAPVLIQSKRHTTPLYLPDYSVDEIPIKEDDEGVSSESAHLKGDIKAQALDNLGRLKFNIIYGFCDIGYFPRVLLEEEEWMIEEISIQKTLFFGKVEALGVPDELYLQYGIMPPDLIAYQRLLQGDSVDAACPIVKRMEDAESDDMQAIEDEYIARLKVCTEVLEAMEEEFSDAQSAFEEDFIEAQGGTFQMETGEETKIDANSFEAIHSAEELTEMKILSNSQSLFDFTKTTGDRDFVELEMMQPMIASSKDSFEVGLYEFEWKMEETYCTQILEIPLPSAIWNNLNSAGSRLLSYFDAAIIQFEAEVEISIQFAVTGELMLVWDECDVLGPMKDRCNQATLLSMGHCIIPAVEAQTSKLIFSPTGVGEFVPLDPAVQAQKLGSLRLFVLYPLVCEDPTKTIPGHVHLRAKVLSTNIMQVPRLNAQSMGGTEVEEAIIPEIDCSQVLFSTKWMESAKAGETIMTTFSPASVFEQDGILQPSLLCNLFRNCKWWTGDCEFELHIDKSPFHSGSLGIGFGSITSEVRSAYDILNTSHVVVDIKRASTFRFKSNVRSWNGKNLFSTGRKSSLPRMDHMAMLRIFVTVMKPLVSSTSKLPSVNFYLMVRKITNLVVGGSTPIKPVFGHWKKGRSGVDFLYSESDGPQRGLLAEMLKQNLQGVQPRGIQPQISLREKFGGFVKQYVLPKIDSAKRYLVLPVAPWSYEFPVSSGVLHSPVNPLIDLCGAFLYWSGSLRFKIVVHRKQSSSNIGGLMTVCYEASGYPIELGLHTGTQPLATGGGKHWNFTFGTTSLEYVFTIPDDHFFKRRYTHLNKFDATKSKLTLMDRLGHLLIYLPSPELVNQIEIHVALGNDMNFSQVRAPTPAAEKDVGDMTSHVYVLEDSSYEAREGVVDQINNNSKGA